MAYGNFSGSISASDLTSNVQPYSDSALDNMRAAHAAETNSSNQELISDAIAAFKTAQRNINTFVGEPYDAGIKPVSGSTTAYINIASISILGSDLQTNIDPYVQNVWSAANTAANALTASSAPANYMQAGCVAAQSALAAWCAILSQPSGAGANSGGTAKH